MNNHEYGKKYKILWGVLIVFVGLNVWLLYGKVNLQRQVSTLQAETLQKEGAIVQLAEPVRFTGTFDFSEQPMGLVALFTDYGCTSCVVSEIEYLNEWKKKYSNTLQVYYLGTSGGYLEDFGAEFEYQQIQSANDLFTVSLPVGNPIITMVDENSNVQTIHTNDLSRPGSDRRRANFYQRVNSLFTAVYGE